MNVCVPVTRLRTADAALRRVLLAERATSSLVIIHGCSACSTGCTRTTGRGSTGCRRTTGRGSTGGGSARIGATRAHSAGGGGARSRASSAVFVSVIRRPATGEHSQESQHCAMGGPHSARVPTSTRRSKHFAGISSAIGRLTGCRARRAAHRAHATYAPYAASRGEAWRCPVAHGSFAPSSKNKWSALGPAYPAGREDARTRGREHASIRAGVSSG